MIQIDHLTKRFDDTIAVDDISLEITKGEVVGLLGPNGAGKTTTLRVLTGYLPPTDGTIHVDEHDIRTDVLAAKKRIGYLPESAPLYPHMLVHDYLVYVARMHELSDDDAMDRIRELADICDIRDVMHKPVNALSKGYKQRVGLAHAMMSDPEILVLDEPTSGLDPNQIIEIRDIIKRVGKEKTVVFSTHILSEAEATCDRIVIIHKGKIVADDATENLKRDASDRYTIKLELTNTTKDQPAAIFEPIEGVVDVRSGEQLGNTLPVTLTCEGSRDVRPDVYQKLKETDWGLLEFHRETHSLETIFRELTKEA